MSHIRVRYLTKLIQKGLSHKGIVGVLGHRQVGKTTLLELLSKRYTTLDKTIELSRANENPASFLEDLHRTSADSPTAIDECQLSPVLFPELKEYVRTHKQPGIFLLSGSVRFSSRKAIRESLTGRILTYELLPFSISELEQKPLNTLALELMQVNDFRRFSFKGLRAYGLLGTARHKVFEKYLRMGGLPGLCFVRNECDRRELIESQLNLILDRDLRLVCETNLSLSRLRILVQILAEHQNRPLNLSEISRKTRISQPTLRKILVGLEAIFFIRQIPCRGNESRPVLFFEDQGEASYLSKFRYDAVDNLERMAYSHLRLPFYYTTGAAFDCFQYRQQGGAYVPIAFQVNQNVIGFLCTLEKTPSLGAIRSAGSFRKAYKGAKVIYLHPYKDVTVLNANEASLPIEFFF